jgi:hypothetical protein
MMLLSLGGFLLLLRVGMASELAFFGAMGIAAVSYFGFCLLFGAITKEDIALIPAGERLLGKFIKTHR